MIKIHHEIEVAPAIIISDSTGNVYAIPAEMLEIFKILDEQIQHLTGTEHERKLVDVWDMLFERHGIVIE